MKNDLDQIARLSVSLNASAKAGRWQELEQIQADRAKLLARIGQCADSTLASHQDCIQQTVALARTLDTETLALVNQHRQELLAEQQKYSRGQRMKKAYGDV